MEKIMGEIMQEHVRSSDDAWNVISRRIYRTVAISQCGDNRVSVSKGRRGSKTAI